MADNYNKLRRRRLINKVYCPNEQCKCIGPMSDDGLDGSVCRARSFSCPDCESFIELNTDSIKYDDVHNTVTTTGIAWIEGHRDVHPLRAVWAMLADFVKLHIDYDSNGPG